MIHIDIRYLQKTERFVILLINEAAQWCLRPCHGPLFIELNRTKHFKYDMLNVCLTIMRGCLGSAEMGRTAPYAFTCSNSVLVSDLPMWMKEAGKRRSGSDEDDDKYGEFRYNNLKNFPISYKGHNAVFDGIAKSVFSSSDPLLEWRTGRLSKENKDKAKTVPEDDIPERVLTCAGCSMWRMRYELKRCVCGKTFYCDQNCQWGHWNVHKADCSYKKEDGASGETAKKDVRAQRKAQRKAGRRR